MASLVPMMMPATKEIHIQTISITGIAMSATTCGSGVNGSTTININMIMNLIIEK
jgi:hypothetical protein